MSGEAVERARTNYTNRGILNVSKVRDFKDYWKLIEARIE